MSLAAIWAAVTSRAGQLLTAIGLALAVVAGAFMSGRRAGKDQAAADAARRGEQTREKADAAARDAARDGAAGRLRDGHF